MGYLAACDIVLNLRYPTVGENSGTLMRALGLGKAVVVSDVGSFSEFPDEHLPESAGGRERRGSSFRISQLAGEPARRSQGAGRAGA